MAEHQITKTQNRSVLGTMNEFAFVGEAHRQSLEVDDLVGLSLRLARTPCGSLRRNHRFPDRELAAFVAELPS
jgi:hypothetical protein